MSSARREMKSLDASGEGWSAASARTFGGAIADVLARRQAAVLRERNWLLSAIVIGAVVFWLGTEYVAFYAAVVITVIIVVGLRVVSVRLDWTDPSFPGGDSKIEDP